MAGVGPPWFRAFARRYPLPSRYLVFDLETSGSNLHTDVIAQFAYALVDAGVVQCELAVTLNWADAGFHNPRDLDDRFDRIRRHIEVDEDGRPTGETFPLSVAKMRRDGVPPLPALAALSELLLDCRAGRVPFVTHCGLKFDRPMLEAALAGFPGDRAFRFRDDEIYDTGAMEKGSQTGDTPFPAEPLGEFLRRVLHKRRDGAGRVKYALHRWCGPRYELPRRYGLDPATAHDALVDCRATYRLFEIYRAFAEERPAP